MFQSQVKVGRPDHFSPLREILGFRLSSFESRDGKTPDFRTLSNEHL